MTNSLWSRFSETFKRRLWASTLENLGKEYGEMNPLGKNFLEKRLFE